MTLTLEEMEEEAVAKVEKDNQGSNQFRTRTFENILNGTLVEVILITQKGEKAKNLVHFDPARPDRRVYKWASDVLWAVSWSRERVWFFRFIELAGIGGVIAFFLVLVFSILLCVLAFVPAANSTVLEVVKLSFTVILGFFFGSQSAGKKSA
jgi:hypothetical protein